MPTTAQTFDIYTHRLQKEYRFHLPDASSECFRLAALRSVTGASPFLSIGTISTWKTIQTTIWGCGWERTGNTTIFSQTTCVFGEAFSISSKAIRKITMSPKYNVFRFHLVCFFSILWTSENGKDGHIDHWLPKNGQQMANAIIAFREKTREGWRRSEILLLIIEAQRCILRYKAFLTTY